MSLTLTSANRDLISLAAFGVVYSAARTEEKAYLDATGSVPTASPAGVAGHAMQRVRQYAQWFEEAGAGSSTGPDVWEQVFVAEAALNCQMAFRRAEVPASIATTRLAWDAALDSYAVTDSSSNTVASQTVTWKSLRLHVIRHCIRRGTARTRLYPSPAAIDTAIQWARTHLWNSNLWAFRNRAVQITIPTASFGSAPTMDLPSGEVFSKVTSKWLILDLDSSSDTAQLRSASQRIMHVESTDLAALKAAFADQTGMPQYFHVEDRGAGSRYWHWLPAPDQQYTARGSVAIALPTTPSDATAASFTMFGDAQTVLPDLVLAKVLRDHNAPGWSQAWSSAADSIELIAPKMDDPGTAARFGLAGVDSASEDFLGMRMGGEGV